MFLGLHEKNFIRNALTIENNAVWKLTNRFANRLINQLETNENIIKHTFKKN